jgi:hypothetical protein
MKLGCAVGCILLSIASWASAQTVGSLQPITDNTGFTPDGLLVAVNYSHPATAAGTVASATLNWAGGPCSGAFKLKFFRRSGDTYSMTTERGPFAATFSLVTVVLSPPVTLAKGDLIGVVHLRSDCGSVIITKIDPNVASFVTILGDVSTFDLRTASLQRGYEVNVRASGDGSVREGVIPVAGSVMGGFGAYFRTSVALTNGRNETIKGRLVFHPAGQAASPSDPSMPYTLTGAQSLSYNDVVASIGTTGLGSIDLISTTAYRPFVNVRIFDDRGTNGTAGFTEDFFAVSEALEATESDSFAIPSDTTNFRMNLGIRTLDLPARVRFTIVSAAGATNTPVELPYAANYFEQPNAAALLGPLPAGGGIRVRVIEGSAIVYASTTDNRTNDSSAQFSRRR